MYKVSNGNKILNVSTKDGVRNFYAGDTLPEDYMPPKDYIEQKIVIEAKRKKKK